MTVAQLLSFAATRVVHCRRCAANHRVIDLKNLRLWDGIGVIGECPCPHRREGETAPTLAVEISEQAHEHATTA